MACFGCFREASVKTLSPDIEEDLVKTGSLPRKKKKNPWITWPKLRNKKSDAKTVPVDLSMSGNLDPNPISKSHLEELDTKKIVASKKHRHPTGVNAINTYKKRLGNVKEIILESRDIDRLNSLAKEDKYDNKNSSRKKEGKKTRSSKSSSLPETINTSTATIHVDQTSLPRPQKKSKSGTRENGNDIASHEKKESKEALDSNWMIGFSVIIVILVLMLFSGKLYAILCTCAWFYMIPRLRTAVDSNVIVNNRLDSNVPDLNSDEHKKKVVLEGLLQRNQRNVIRIL